MSVTLASAVTTTQVASAPFASDGWRITSATPQYSYRTFQATGSVSTSTGAATVKIQVSNNNTNWIDLGTITLTLGTTATTDGFSSNATWEYVRAYIATGGVTGTNGTVTVLMGV
jgi:hypothetical protein